jgi:hypothetical protein
MGDNRRRTRQHAVGGWPPTLAEENSSASDQDQMM